MGGGILRTSPMTVRVVAAVHISQSPHQRHMHRSTMQGNNIPVAAPNFVLQPVHVSAVCVRACVVEERLSLVAIHTLPR